MAGQKAAARKKHASRPSAPHGTAADTVLLRGQDPVNAQGEQAARREEIRQRFGLTIAETALALEIMHGDGRQGAAERLGITISTVRTHLTRIFQKTGTRRQTELIRLLMQQGRERAARRRDH